MSTLNPSIKEMLLDDLPPGFVSELTSKLPGIYADSYDAMMNDPNLGVDQAKVVLGHYRRGRAETLFQETAAQHGISNRLIRPAGGGCTHIRVQVGRFQLVMCHVISRDAFPQHSDEREQSARLNSCIAQLDMLSEEVTLSEGELFGVIIHTEVTGKKNEFGSIKIGFSDPEWKGWAEEPIDLIEISDIQAQRYQKKTDLQAQVQVEKAKPRWKPQKDKAANDEQDE